MHSLLRRITLVLAEICLLLLITTCYLYPDAFTIILTSIQSMSLSLRIASVIVLDLLLIAAIYSQLQPTTRYTGEGLLVKDSESITAVSTESVHQAILNALHQVPNIAECDGKTQSIRGRMQIELNLFTDSDTLNIPQKTKEVNQVIRQIVAKQMGIQFHAPPTIHMVLKSASAPTTHTQASSKAPSTPVSISNPLSAPVTTDKDDTHDKKVQTPDTAISQLNISDDTPS